MTTASPALMRPPCTAANAASSESNTRAGPREGRGDCGPESFTTQPAGARLPRRMTSPPLGLERRVRPDGRPPGPAFRRAVAASSAIVRPVTVTASACSAPTSSSRLATRRVPPAACRSVATKRPPGFRSARTGTRALTRSKSSRSSGTPASRAIATRCRTALVDPPVAATDAMAFSSASRVRMSRRPAARRAARP